MKVYESSTVNDTVLGGGGGVRLHVHYDTSAKKSDWCQIKNNSMDFKCVSSFKADFVE